MNNYFDLFTGMFAQPEAPCFTKITVSDKALLFNSYTADQNGNATLINTMRVIRNKPHTVPTGYEDVAPATFVPTTGKPLKFIRDGLVLIRIDGQTYNVFGQKIAQ